MLLAGTRTTSSRSSWQNHCNRGAVGQAGAEGPVGFAQERAGQVAAQGATGVFLELLLLADRDMGQRVVRVALSVAQAGGDEVGFEAGLGEQLVDALELLAEGLVIDITLDGGGAGGGVQSEVE